MEDTLFLKGMWTFQMVNGEVDSIFSMMCLTEGARDPGPTQMADGILVLCPVTTLRQGTWTLGTLGSSSANWAL